MHADSSRATWAGLLLATALLSTGCVSLTPAPDQGVSLRYTALESVPPLSAAGPSVEAPGALPFPPEPEAPRRLHRRPASREEATAVGPDRAEKATRQSALAAQLAFRRALLDVSDSSHRLSAGFSRLQVPGRSIGGGHSVFINYVHVRRYGVPMEFTRWRGP